MPMVSTRPFLSTNVSHCLVLIAGTLAVMALAPSLTRADGSLNPGDVLVSTRSGLVRIDRFGAQTIASTGKIYDNARAIAIDTHGDILLGARLPATQTGSPAPEGGILRIDRTTGRSTIVASGEHLSDPTDIAVDPNGDLLVTDSDSKAVLRIDPTTGAQTIVSSGGALSSPSAIALATNGQLFVTDHPYAVIRVDPTTGAQTVITSAPPSLGSPTGIVIDASGDLLITNRGPSAIVRVNPATGTQTVIATEGQMIIDGRLVTSLFKWPRDIALEASGDLLVLSGGTRDGVIRLNPVTLSQEAVPWSSWSFERPWAIALDASGDIFVADLGRISSPGSGTYNSQVLRVDPLTGKATDVSSAYLFGQGDIAIEASGDILVLGSRGVVRVDLPTGHLALVAPLSGGQMALDPNGEIYVARNGGLLRVDPLTGDQVTVTPSGTLESVWDLVVDGDGNVLVVEGGCYWVETQYVAASVSRVNPVTGVATVVSSGDLRECFYGITINANGDIFVSGSRDHRAAVIRIDPTTGNRTVVSSGGLLEDLRAIAADADGGLLVTDEDVGGVILVDPETGSQTLVAAGGALGRPRGIAIVPFGESPFQPFAPGPVSRKGQKCIKALNKSLAKVAKAQRRDNLVCIKRGARGELPGTIEECLVGDLRGKVAKAMARTVSAEAKRCTGNPFSFGASDSATVNDTAMRREIDLIHDIFGSDLDIAILPETTDKKGAICQQAVAKAVNKCQATNLKAFNKCKKTTLKDNITDVALHLQNCMGQDPKHEIAKVCDPGASELRSAVGWRCTGADRSVAFPRRGTDDEAELARYLEESVNCRVCQALNQADVLSRDCDEFDDGLVNASCP
jgi:streptogramin lyase